MCGGPALSSSRLPDSDLCRCISEALDAATATAEPVSPTTSPRRRRLADAFDVAASEEWDPTSPRRRRRISGFHTAAADEEAPRQACGQLDVVSGDIGGAAGRPPHLAALLLEARVRMEDAADAASSPSAEQETAAQVAFGVDTPCELIACEAPTSPTKGCSWVEEAWPELFAGILAADLPSRLLAHLGSLHFEARKDAMRLFAALLRCGAAAPELRDGIVGYVRGRPEIARMLLEGCGQPEAALICGQMLRACTRHEELVKLLLEEARAGFDLIALARHPSFDVASDAFESLHELLLTHKTVAAAYLESNFRCFFEAFNSLLKADDYVTRRQALRLLGEMLLQGEYLMVMLQYVASDIFLRIHMNLLLDRSPSIQLGAFHVFKIFAANPRKPPRVQKILARNAERLCRRIELLPPLRGEDEDLFQDVSAVVAALRTLTPPSSPESSPASSSDGSATPVAALRLSEVPTPHRGASAPPAAVY